MSQEQEIAGMDTPAMEIRGHTVYNRPASVPIIILAYVVDLSLALSLFLLTVQVFGLSPVPRKRLLALFLAEVLIYFWVPRWRRWVTPGQKVWRLSGRPWVQKEILSPGLAVSGIFLTALATTTFFGMGHQLLTHHPLLRTASTWTVEAAVPNLKSNSLSSEQWQVAPFFYSMGAWPKIYGGNPVFYSLPYEKGPPTRFVGHIIARWQMPDVKITFEGPKTPGALMFKREDLRDCLEMSALSQYFGSWRCLKFRERALDRHIEEMSSVSPVKWSMRWLRVTNPSIPGTEEVQGVYLSAVGVKRGQDRMILVSGEGKHQAIILDYPVGPAGDTARGVFEQALRSLRVSDELGRGKAWVDRQLESIKLDDLRKISRADLMAARLAEIQSVLLAKISVDPKTFDAFYHLGGTALMLVQQGAKEKKIQEDWVAAVRPLIQNMYRYAQDIAPTDPRTGTLQNMWVESKKY